MQPKQTQDTSYQRYLLEDISREELIEVNLDWYRKYHELESKYKKAQIILEQLGFK